MGRNQRAGLSYHSSSFSSSEGSRACGCTDVSRGRLADLDREAFQQRRRVIGQRQQVLHLLGKHVPDCAVWFARAASVGSKPATPVISLSIEIVEIGETAGGEERAADGADAPFDAALLIAPGELIRRATPTDPCGTALASAAWRAFVSVFACPLDDLLYIAVCIRSDARS